MSSLRVTGVTLNIDPGRKLAKAQDWIRFNIQKVMNSLELIYKSIPEESSKNLLLINELRNVAAKLLNNKYLPHTMVDSVAKDFEIFSRKAEKLQIFFRQKRLESQESEILERYYTDNIKQLCSISIKEGILAPDDEEFIRIKSKFIEINNTIPLSKRLIEYKKLYKKVHLLSYELREKENFLNSKAELLKKEILPLRNRDLTAKQSDLIQRFYRILVNIGNISTMHEREKVINNIEKAVTRLSHAISGKEYFDLVELKNSENLSSIQPPKETIPDPVKRILIEEEYLFFRKRILSLKVDEADENEYELLTDDISLERLILMRDNLQLEYGLLKEQIPVWNYVKEELRSIIENISSDPEAGSLFDDAIELSENPYPDPKELAGIRRRYSIYTLYDIISEISDNEWMDVLKIIMNEFDKCGYTPPDLSDPDIIQSFLSRNPLEIGIRSSEYILLLSLNPLDELVFRIYKTNNSDKNFTEKLTSATEEDYLVSNLFDNDYNAISNDLKRHGIIFSEKVARDPEVFPIHYIDR